MAEKSANDSFVLLTLVFQWCKFGLQMRI